MRSFTSAILAISLLLGLAACAERGSVRPEGAAAPAAAPGASTSGKVAPPPVIDGSAPAPSVPPPAAASERSGTPGGQREASDAEVADCYRYARATIAHDRRIEQDRGSAGGFGSLGSDVGAASAQLSRVGEASTFDRAFDSCMSSKGYGRQ